MRHSLLAFLTTALFTATQSLAQTMPTPPENINSLGFGIGIGSTWLHTTNVQAAEVTNGLVRVVDDEKHQRSFWLETHYLLDRFRLGPYTSHGPFLAAQFNGDNGIFDALAAATCGA